MITFVSVVVKLLALSSLSFVVSIFVGTTFLLRFFYQTMERNAQLSGKLHGNWIYHTETPGKMISHIQGAPLSQRDPHISGKIGNLGPYSSKSMWTQIPIFPGNMVHKAPIYEILIIDIYLTNTFLATAAILLFLDTDLLRQACSSYYTQPPDTTSLQSLILYK